MKMMKKRISVLLVVALICVNAQEDDFESEEVTVETEPERVVDIPYDSPIVLDSARVYLAEHFDDRIKFDKSWIKSAAKKEGISEDIAKYDGVWAIEESNRDGLINDFGLVLKSKAKHAAIASRLIKPFVFTTKPLIVQYEVIFQEGQECGGAYLKLLSEGPDAKNLGQFTDKTPYTIMFGPDKCGNDHKLHFIFRHRNPKNGTVEEKHCKKPKERLEEAFSDKLPHLYTLVLNPDNTYEISLDKVVINSGSLFEDFTPAVNPPQEIDDPNDNKPEDWDDREKIADPEALKPTDWDEDAPAQIVDENAVMPDAWLEDEPTHIPDINAQKPADWDPEIDGEWEPPLVDNPACATAVGCGKWEAPLINNPEFKGKWKAALIDNPNYKGKWRPKLIQNPDYFEDKHPFKMNTIAAIGFELWSMSQDILFDNIIITDDMEVAQKWAADTFDLKRQKIAKDSVSLWGRMMKQMAYRPKAWGLYFIYCMIPISIYVWYLYSCYAEESVVQKLANLTNEYPALWAVYILVLAVPVVLILYLCCKPSSSPSTSHTKQQEKEEEQKIAAEIKKTDERTEDDVRVTEEPEEEEEEEEEEEDDKEKYSGEDADEDEEEIKKEPTKKEEATRKRKPRKE